MKRKKTPGGGTDDVLSQGTPSCAPSRGSVFSDPSSSSKNEKTKSSGSVKNEDRNRKRTNKNRIESDNDDSDGKDDKRR